MFRLAGPCFAVLRFRLLARLVHCTGVSSCLRPEGALTHISICEMTNDTFSQNSNQGAQSQTTDDAANPPIVISPQAQAPRKPKVALSEGEFRVAHVQQLPYSRNGNPRWRLTVTCPVTSQAYVFTTKSDVSSSHYCSLNRVRVGEYIHVKYRESKSGKLVAEGWEACHHQARR